MAMFKDNPPKPKPALPTEPGTVVIATVRGVPDVKLMHMDDLWCNDWISAKTVLGVRYHDDNHITDWRYPEAGE